MAAAMGLTAIAIVYSRWGKRSGTHINPSVTLTFLRLGRVAAPDAAFYVAAQFVGAALGLALPSLVVGNLLAEPAINFAATVPGEPGPWLAFAAEAAISFGLMLVILTVSNQTRLNRCTGLCAGLLAATELFVRLRGAAAVLCRKLDHGNDHRCIFRCRYPMHSAAMAPAPETPEPAMPPAAGG